MLQKRRFIPRLEKWGHSRPFRVKNAKGGTEINLQSKKTSTSSSKSSSSSSSSAKKTASEIATEPIEDADTKALNADQCIAWGTAAYSKQHHLSFADTTDLEAKVTNEDGYGYMFNGKKKVARYRITSKDGLYDVKLKRVISKKPIQICQNRMLLTNPLLINPVELKTSAIMLIRLQQITLRLKKN